MTDPDTLIEIRARAIYRLLSDLSDPHLSGKEKIARCELSMLKWLEGIDIAS